MKKHNRIILTKMKKYAELAIELKGGLGYQEFLSDYKTTCACIFHLSQIGELVCRLDEEFIKSTDHIPWKKMRGMRNHIVHDYEGIQYGIIWKTLTESLPQLIEDVDNLLTVQDV